MVIVPQIGVPPFNISPLPILLGPGLLELFFAVTLITPAAIVIAPHVLIPISAFPVPIPVARSPPVAVTVPPLIVIAPHSLLAVSESS